MNFFRFIRLQHFCREAIRHVRNLLIARVCGAESDLIAATPDQRPALARAAAQFSEEDLTRFFQILLQTDDDLRRKPDPRIHLEMGLLRLINAARLAPLEELMAEMKNGGAGGSAPPASGARGSSAAPVVRGAAAGAAAATAPFSRSEVGAPAAQGAVRAEVAPERPSFVAQPVAPPAGRTAPVNAPATNASEVAEQDNVPKTNGHTVQFDGITLEQVGEIKTAIQAQQKFVAELIEHANRWELDGVELRICFSPDKQTFAGLLDSRDTLEKIRGVSSKVLGRSVRVCAKIQSVAAAAASGSASVSGTQELRARFEQDPIVRSMLQRFGGKITEVRRQEES